MHQRLNVKNKSIQIPEENMDKFFYTQGVGETFLIITPNPNAIREKTHIVNCITIKKVLIGKKVTHKVKITYEKLGNIYNLYHYKSLVTLKYKGTKNREEKDQTNYVVKRVET